MIVLIPLGGLGSRFKDNGYTKPKALVNALGKPILYWLLDSLKESKVDYIYIPYNIEYKKYRLEDQILKDYPDINFKFLPLKEDTRGAAETIHIALDHLVKDDVPDSEVLCLDGDNFYSNNIVSLWGGKNAVVTFVDQSQSTKPIYSYVSVDQSLKINNIVEKEKISDLACSGAYGFNSFYSLNTYCKKVVENNIRQKDEFYTSNVIKLMIEDGVEFSPVKISKSDVTCLGTPLQLRLFCNNYPKKSSLSNDILVTKKRYCFDLDNTLVTFPKVTGDYSTVEPIQENINLLKYLKSFGHEIIIYTARRMKTHGGNVGKSMADIGKTTFDTLQNFDIPYDEIYFNKPQADCYVDDLASHVCNDLEKELGFYNSLVEPREFNNLNSLSIEIYRKESSDLSGEIYFYENVPSEIKDMFPILMRKDEANTWYDIEKINGVPASKLYLSETLTKDNLTHILNSINRIHAARLDNAGQNIYLNYTNKLTERYGSYDYSKYTGSDQLYQSLREALKDYEGRGVETVIHGDTVLTNIIINEFGKIKFVDMRGKLGDELSLSGDSLYDWAKVYQSLIGYDEILESRTVDNNYKQIMIDHFKDHFFSTHQEQHFEDLKTITKSLLFTLIPLHDNKKCASYYDLINSNYLK